MALVKFYGVLQQQKQAEEMTRIRALEKQQKMKKRERTPNTMRGDAGVGIVMILQDHDKQTELENSAARVEGLKKSTEKLEKALDNFTGIRLKYRGLIDFEKCTGKELSILIVFMFPDSGFLSKVVGIKKGQFRENAITPENINYLSEQGYRKLTQWKLELSKFENQPGG